MGVLPDRFPGYCPVTNPAARTRLEKIWQTTLPDKPGLGAQAVLEDGGRGAVKGVWLLRYDPVTTAVFCDAARTLKQMDLVVMQHLFMISTTPYAHVILPVVAFGEEQVSFTSTDRRIQLAEKVIEPPPGPQPAWWQLTEVARALGADWNYQSAQQVMDEIGQVVPLYSGASYDNLRRDYGRQWPCTKDKPLGTQYLFADGLPPKAFKFVPVPKPAAVSTSPEFPMAVVFGSSLYYWHQNVLVKHSETLKRELRVLLLDYPEGFVEVNTEDAKLLGLRDGAKIRLVGQRGASVTTARVTHEVRSGTVSAPFFVKEVMSQIMGEGAFEAVSRTKPVFVRIEKV
jgi:predicted molibdopterin-dependent oxidoreductase YjgC